MSVSKAIEKGSKKIICASTGNTSASASAFGSYCGLETIVLIPEGKIAIGKLSQAVAYGAKIVSIYGNFDQALNLVKEISEQQEDIELVNSINPNKTKKKFAKNVNIIVNILPMDYKGVFTSGSYRWWYH